MDPENNLDQATPDIHSENIKEEFYRWFESRGLLSELRSYMRQLMVKALDDSKNKTQQRKSASSPKLQAINLLIVDHLFHEDYLYTVSVFASEAQILDSLPQYSHYITESIRQRHWEPSSLPRFSPQETEDILDTLRLPPSSRDARQAIQAYLSGTDSLLTCVVRALADNHHSFSLDDIRASEEMGLSGHGVDECVYQLWSQEMQNLLLLAGVKLHHIRRMQQKWAQIIEEERNRVVQEMEEAREKEREEWEQMMKQCMQTEMDEQVREQLSRVELREQGLAGLAEQLTVVHDDISHRLAQLQIQSSELQQREAKQEEEQKQLQDRLNKVQEREAVLEQATHQLTLIEEQSLPITEVEDQVKLIDSVPGSSHQAQSSNDASVQVSLMEHDTDQGVDAETQTAEVVVVVSTQTIDTEDHEQQTSAFTELDPQLILQVQSDRERINELQEENLELRAYALQQRQRIDELTNRAADLSSQLEEARISITVLSGRESAVVATAPPPLPPGPTSPQRNLIVPTFGYNTPQRIGAGEESLFTPRLQQNIPRNNGRRRPSRFAFSQNPSPISDESSPTDEIIQNARARIQQLEEESVAVQRSYQEFHTRLLSTDSVMFPPLGSPRTHHPMMRVRRNEGLPGFSLLRIPYQLSRPSSPICDDTHDEANEESNSDQALLYETNRIHNFTNSRRIYSQRNLRHFERWKQFKKKFQRRENFDQRRNIINCNQSNTSSDDDEQDLRHLKWRQENNNFRKTNESRQSAPPQRQSSSNCHTKSEVVKKPDGNSFEPFNNDNNFKTKDNFQSTIAEIVSSKSLPMENVPPKNKETCEPTQSLAEMENKLKSEVDRSVKLIESVRSLLEARNNNPPKSTLSNGSLAVESLPRDSSQDDNLNTDFNSIITIQNVRQIAQEEKIESIQENKLSPQKSQSKKLEKNTSSILVSDIEENLNIIHGSLENEHDEKVEDLQHTPLTVPALEVVSPRKASTENWINTDPVISLVPADGDHDSGDDSTSVTSASDILRELNPSKNESSDSVISTGCAEASRHSSDFWN